MLAKVSGSSIALQIVVSAATFLALPLLFVFVYVRWAHAPISAVLPHLFIIVSIGGGVVGIRLLISLLPIKKALKHVLATLVVFSVLFGLVLLYAGVLVGIRFWGRPASVQLVSTYLGQLPETLRVLGYTPVLVVFVAGAIFLLVAIVIYLFLQRCDWVSAIRRFISPSVTFIAAIGLLCITSVSFATLEHRFLGALGEPLSLALFPHQGALRAQNHRISILRTMELQRQNDVARFAYAPANDAKKSNIVLIVVDALRADHLSLLGYKRRTTPYLEQMQAEGKVRLATSAVAVCNESLCGLNAIAGSQSVANQTDRLFTLHEVLKKYGYAVHLILSGDHQNFYGLDKIYGPLDSYFDGASQKARYVNDDRLVLDRLSSLEQWDGTPTLFQLHLMSAHALGFRFEEIPEFGISKNYAVATGFNSSTEDLQQTAINHYDKGVFHADKVIAKVLMQLQQFGYLDDALVVITGDHGEALGEHGEYNHASSVWEGALRVPFLLLVFGKADLGDRKSVV